MFFVYIMISEKDGSLYTGQTKDIKKRLQQHNQGKVLSTRSKRPLTLRYFEIHGTRREAMFREWELKKKWNTDRKKKLIAAFDQLKCGDILGL
ncbi:MAG: GIY-YIG nuclease family protein [Bacteroidota bacterium]